jgi:hypothetical protein
VDSCSWAVVVGRWSPTGPHPGLRLRGQSCRRQRPRDVELVTARPGLPLARTHARAGLDASDPNRLASLLDEVKAPRHRRCAGWHGATSHEQRDQDPQHADLQPACDRSAAARRLITELWPALLRHASRHQRCRRVAPVTSAVASRSLSEQARDQGYSVLARACLRSRTRRPAKWRPDHFSADVSGRTSAKILPRRPVSPVHPRPL